MHLRRRFAGFAVASMMLSGARSTLQAQASVEAGPLVGYYLPSGDRSGNDGQNVPANFAGPAVGAELSVWSGHRFGVRGDAAFTRKDADPTTNPGGWEPRAAGDVTFASALAAYDISPERLRTVWLAAGPGVIHHGGAAFARSGNPTNMAAVLAIGSNIPVSHSVGLTLGATGYVYRYGGIFGLIGGPPRPGVVTTGYYARRSQHDIVFSGALTYIGHRSRAASESSSDR